MFDRTTLTKLLDSLVTIEGSVIYYENEFRLITTIYYNNAAPPKQNAARRSVKYTPPPGAHINLSRTNY